MRDLPELASPKLLALDELRSLPEGPIAWDAIFERSRPLRLEIGVGNSPFLIAVAQAEPEFNYLGLEYSRRRVAKFLKKLHNAGLDNVRVLAANSDLVIPDRIAPETVDHVFVNFPDPWPKRRHLKRRLVRRDRIEAICSVLRPGGGISLRTDAPDYAAEALAVLESLSELENLGRPGAFGDTPRFAFETPYEIKFKQQGLRIYYLEYRKRRGGLSAAGRADA